jgi:hypothetical protein
MLPDRARRRSGSPIFRATVASVLPCAYSGVHRRLLYATHALPAATVNLWPPFVFACIRVCAIKADFRSPEVELRMRPWNRNYLGTHFGDSLFAMVDLFWMQLTMYAPGHGFVVCDKAGEIEFSRLDATRCASA